jgi:hypothetical protein
VDEVTDKSVVGINHIPKGQAYCDVPGTSCTYDENQICVNCFRTKGWRRKTPIQRRTMETPYGDTSTLHNLGACTFGLPPDTPILIRVIERPAIIEIVDGEPEDISRMRIHAAAEYRTFVLDPEDIEFQDGAIWLVVGEQE